MFVFLAYRIVHITVRQTRTHHIKAHCRRVSVTAPYHLREGKQPLEVAHQHPDPFPAADRGREKDPRLKKFPKLFHGFGCFHQRQVIISGIATM